MRFKRIDTKLSVFRHQTSSSRRARLLPLLLLVLVVSTLVAISLSHMAVMHQSSSMPPSSSHQSTYGAVEMSSSAAATVTMPSTTTTTVRKVKAALLQPNAVVNSRQFKLEPLISRNITSVDVHALRLRNAANEYRVANIIGRATRKDTDRPSIDLDIGDFITLKRFDHNGSTANGSGVFEEEEEPVCVKTSQPLRPFCPQVPPHLIGELYPENHTHTGTEMSDVIEDNPDVCPGGWWSPPSCLPRHRVAIVIPYRDRESHLVTLLAHLHPLLQRQQLHYQIIVAEQIRDGTFNKGVLMNAAFTIAMTQGNFQCFVFHDVDLIPENDRNLYSCPPDPRHMSVGVDEFDYVLPYSALVGGVFAIRADHFLMVNGYSNMYWGWGGEDDDMSYRLAHVGLSITRPSVTVARYRMIKHVKRKPLVWKIRGKLLNTAKRRLRFDGLNSLNYTLLAHEDYPLYTNLSIDPGLCPATICRT